MRASASPPLPDEPLASRKVPPQTDRRDRGGGRGGRGAARRQARRRQGLGGDRAGLHAPRALSEAAHAYAEALRLLGEDPLRRAAYGEALVAAAGGVVTDEARAGVRPGAGRAARPAAGALSISRSPPSRTAKRPTRSATTNRSPPTRRPTRPGSSMVNARLAALKGEPGRPRPDAAADSRGAAADDRGHGVETRRRGSPATAAASTNGRALFAPIRCCMRPTRPRRRWPTRARRSRRTPSAVASLDALARNLGLGDAN